MESLSKIVAIILFVVSNQFAAGWSNDIPYFFKASGTIEEGNETALEMLKSEFAVEVRDSQWRMRIKVFTGEKLVDRTIWSIDPTETYELRKYANLVPLPSGQTLQKRHTVGKVLPGPFPRPCEPAEISATHLWVLFASQSFLKTNSADVPVIYDVNSCLSLGEDFLVQVRANFSPFRPGLPTSVSFYNDKGIFRREAGGGSAYSPFTGALPGGTTSAVYRVTHATNHGGLTLPLTARFDRFAANPGNNLLDYHAVITVTNVAIEPLGTSLALDLPENTVVIDERLRRFKPIVDTQITYSSKRHNKWLTMEELRLLHRNQIEKSAATSSK